jgi:hypothetical protein
MISHDELLNTISYDPETGEFYWIRKTRGWCRVNRQAGWVDGGYRNIFIKDSTGYKKKYKAHRLAWFYMTGRWPDGDIDHKNMDRADNRFENLRESDRTHNRANTGRRSDNKSGFKGVCFRPKSGKYHAQIQYKGKPYHLGYYDTPQDAHEAYKKKSAELFGDFARYE